MGSIGFTPEILRVTRMRGCVVVGSPHNTFARRGAFGVRLALEHVLRRSDRIFVYSKVDLQKLSYMAPRIGLLNLVQWMPDVSPDHVRAWRTRLAAEGANLALLAGQVREDKNPELFVSAICGLDGWRGAIVGVDLGAGESLVRFIRQTQDG